MKCGHRGFSSRAGVKTADRTNWCADDLRPEGQVNREMYDNSVFSICRKREIYRNRCKVGYLEKKIVDLF